MEYVIVTGTRHIRETKYDKYTFYCTFVVTVQLIGSTVTFHGEVSFLGIANCNVNSLHVSEHCLLQEHVI